MLNEAYGEEMSVRSALSHCDTRDASVHHSRSSTDRPAQPYCSAHPQRLFASAVPRPQSGGRDLHCRGPGGRLQLLTLNRVEHIQAPYLQPATILVPDIETVCLRQLA